MKKNIVICGASGSIGTALVKVLQARGSKVSVISRNAQRSAVQLPSVQEHASWSDLAACAALVAQADAVVNLSGASVGELRWTPSNKKLIMSSRIESTRTCVDLLLAAPKAERCFVSASAIGYYGFGASEWKTEKDTAGTDFLAQVCAKWEATSQAAASVCRVVNPRIGIVMDTQSGALSKLLIPFRFFVGGPLGNGKQWYSWIHRDDLIASLLHCIDNEQLSGPVNCVAPNPVQMDEFAACIATALHRPKLFRVPEFALRLLLGEQHCIVSKGQRVSAKSLQDSGFLFRFVDCQSCINDLVKAH